MIVDSSSSVQKLACAEEMTVVSDIDVIMKHLSSLDCRHFTNDHVISTGQDEAAATDDVPSCKSCRAKDYQTSFRTIITDVLNDSHVFDGIGLNQFV
jgi:hypothetical protein